MFRTLPSHVRDASRFSTKSRKHGVQAMSRAQARSQAFWAVSGTWCAMSWIRQGRRLIFRHLCAVFGHFVLAMSGMLPVAAGMQPDFQSFLGSFWVTVSRPCPGCYKDFHVFLCIFLDTVCRQCSGGIGATAGMQPDF
ncbi:Hypothetical predicted protein [Olea europaea subsp. europaea]|uniref:Uncharacterized protein n=1 Tax=Olea europaea subsp. europaea TaxID=158383 RepID=A0A8S0TQT2_OLEEU|nr:Hypothetical predicted protein [Olea europaea subsp. europaea]